MTANQPRLPALNHQGPPPVTGMSPEERDYWTAKRERQLGYAQVMERARVDEQKYIERVRRQHAVDSARAEEEQKQEQQQAAERQRQDEAIAKQEARKALSRQLAGAFPAPYHCKGAYVWNLVVEVEPGWHTELNNTGTRQRYDTHVEIHTERKNSSLVNNRFKRPVSAVYNRPGCVYIHAWYDPERHQLVHAAGGPPFVNLTWEEVLQELCPEFYQHHGEEQQYGVMYDIRNRAGRYATEDIKRVGKFDLGRISNKLQAVLSSPVDHPTIYRRAEHRIA